MVESIFLVLKKLSLEILFWEFVIRINKEMQDYAIQNVKRDLKELGQFVGKKHLKNGLLVEWGRQLIHKSVLAKYLIRLLQ